MVNGVGASSWKRSHASRSGASPRSARGSVGTGSRPALDGGGEGDGIPAHLFEIDPLVHGVEAAAGRPQTMVGMPAACHSGASIQYGAWTRSTGRPREGVLASLRRGRPRAGRRGRPPAPRRRAATPLGRSPARRPEVRSLLDRSASRSSTSASASPADSPGTVRRSTTARAEGARTNGDSPPLATVTMREPPLGQGTPRSSTATRRRPRWVTALTPSSGWEEWAARPSRVTSTRAYPRKVCARASHVGSPTTATSGRTPSRGSASSTASVPRLASSSSATRASTTRPGDRGARAPRRPRPSPPLRSSCPTLPVPRGGPRRWWRRTARPSRRPPPCRGGR